MRPLRTLLAAAAVGALGTACAAPVQGPYGRYPERTQELRLPSDTLVVYRMRAWTHVGSAGTALQIEYATPLPLGDTVALRALARYVWPSFAPYVEAAKVDRAMLTATALDVRGIYVVRRWSLRHYNVVAARDSSGVWRMWGEGTPLPPADTGAPRFYDAWGRAVPFSDAAPANEVS